MFGSRHPDNETDRLKHVRDLGILDTAGEDAFDRLTTLAAGITGCPVALLSLIDAEREWIKSSLNFPTVDIPREVSLSAHAILSKDVFVVPDAATDPRFTGNPLVSGSPGIRFYAAAPLVSSEGFIAGTLAVADVRPHDEGLPEEARTRLLGLAAVAVHTLDFRRRAQNQVRDAFAMLDHVLDQSLDVICTLNESGAFLRVSAASAFSMGYAPTELFHRRLIDFLIPEDRARAEEWLASVQSGIPSRQFPVRWMAPAGRIVPLVWSAAWSDENNVIVGVARDYTEQDTAQESIRRSEARYRLLFENNPHPMWVYDTESFRFLAVNAVATEVYGYSKEEFLAMSILDVRPEADHEKFLAYLAAESPSGSRSGPWRHGTKEGAPLFMEINSREIEFEGRRARLVIASDVGARIALEDQLRQAHKMEAVGQLAGGIAHDFNNLLTVINGYASWLLEQTPEASAEKAPLAQILKAGQRAAGMTGQLLAFSRKQVLQPKVLSLNETLSASVAMLRRLIPSDIKFDLQLAPGLHPVKLDPIQIEQVFLNLSLNAKDAMSNGGTLTIETANVYLDEAYAAKKVDVAPGNHAMLAVSDTGEGMTAEVLSRAFDPFFTTKEKGRGTGLGLSMVQGIVKQSGGHIYVYSEPGVGTTVKLYFPAVEESAEIPVSRLTDSAAAGHETILLVEDDEDVRQFTAHVLEALGYKVLTAAAGPEAIELASAQAGEIDLLITDVIMPGMNGRQLAEALTAARPAMRVLYISGYTENAVTNHGVLDAGLNFLAKPFVPESLARKVKQIMEAPVPHKTILVVDDEEAVREFFSQVLLRAGYTVISSHDGADAVAKLKQSHVHAVVLDLVMPGQEGIETMQQLRRGFPDVPVIAVSGAARGSDYLRAAKALGARIALCKPISAEALTAAVREILP